MLTVGVVGAAAILGLSAGFSPGPLLALVIAQTIRHGTREGIKVSVAPLVTDAPIIALSVFLISRFADIHNMLGLISIAGGLFVIYLAWETFRAKHPSADIAQGQIQSLGRGIAVNALSPHPYIFWITVGSPMIIRAYREGPAHAILFMLSFYICLIGAKVLVSYLVGRTKRIFTEKVYRFIMGFLGLALFVFAIVLIRDGLSLLTILTKFP
ncbi:MAG: rane protein, LysE superfamily [Deltaproteobacteria bacterium]|nr:rane protein, LysE superfamily [Deltaproteobacteria bacterium]